MKNLILTITLTVVLFACKSNNNPLINGDVSSIKESEYGAVEKFGEVIKGGLNYVRSYEYDKNGNQTTFIIYDEEGDETYKSTTSYKDNEATSTYTKHSVYKEFTEQRTVIFKDDYKTVWLSERKEDEKASTDTIIYTRTKNGKEATETTKHNDGSQSIRYITFDDKWRIIEFKWLMDGVNVQQWELNKYLDNQLIQKDELDEDTGLVRNSITYKYKLDDKQNWVECIEYEDDKAERVIERTINYR
ncbi:MAG: hypothetical protein ACK5L5_12370 [Bacteroidales bacterium]